MKFKEFKKWCYDRSIDGGWNVQVANLSIQIINIVNWKPFWLRERFWANKWEEKVVRAIVEPFDKLRKEAPEGTNLETYFEKKFNPTPFVVYVVVYEDPEEYHFEVKGTYYDPDNARRFITVNAKEENLKEENYRIDTHFILDGRE